MYLDLQMQRQRHNNTREVTASILVLVSKPEYIIKELLLSFLYSIVAPKLGGSSGIGNAVSIIFVRYQDSGDYLIADDDS